MTTTLRNFSERYRGRVTSILVSGFSLGVLFYYSIYNNFFIDGHIDDPVNQNLSGYFLFTALFSGSINIISPFVYGYYPEVEDSDGGETEDLLSDKNDSSNVKSVSISLDMNRFSLQGKSKMEEDESNQDSNLWQLVTNPVYHMLVWPAAIIMSLETVNVGNLTTYLYSFHQEEYVTTLPYVTPTISLLLKFPLGWLSDILLDHHISRTWWILMANILKLIAFILGVFFLDKIWILTLDLILWDIATVLTLVNMPAIFVQEFGNKTF